MMIKFCVFCGNKPESKNKEHVLPKWLLNITGDENRKTTINVDKYGNEVKFSWSHLTVPSCTECNTEFSLMEKKAKYVIEQLLDRKQLTGNDILILLDWLDKVRIGLWINYYYLGKNKMNINPKLCIKNRIGNKDRFLQVFFFDKNKSMSGLNAFGVDQDVFQLNPSCFALRINNLLILNGSNDLLVSKNCGFPYPKSIKTLSNGTLDLSNWIYDRKNYKDIEGLDYIKSNLTVMQPIHTNISFENYNFYDDSYIIKNCLDIKNKIGTIFVVKNNNLQPIYGLDKFIEYESTIKKESISLEDLVRQVYKAQYVFYKRYNSNNKAP